MTLHADVIWVLIPGLCGTQMIPKAGRDRAFFRSMARMVRWQNEHRRVNFGFLLAEFKDYKFQGRRRPINKGLTGRTMWRTIEYDLVRRVADVLEELRRLFPSSEIAVTVEDFSARWLWRSGFIPTYTVMDVPLISKQEASDWALWSRGEYAAVRDSSFMFDVEWQWWRMPFTLHDRLSAGSTLQRTNERFGNWFRGGRLHRVEEVAADLGIQP